MKTTMPTHAYDGSDGAFLMDTPDVTEPAPKRSAIKFSFLGPDSHFRVWFAADTSQMVSRALTSVALPLLAVAVTTSPSAAGLVVAAGTAGASVALLPGGMLADRLDRGRLVGLLAGLTAVAYCLIAVFGSIAPAAGVAWLICAVFCASLFQAMAAPAFSATLKSLVTADRFAAAASLSEGRSAALGLAVPAAGGSIYMLGGWVPFLLAAVMTLLAAYLYCRLPTRATAAKWEGAPAKHQGFWSGVRFVIHNRTLGALVLTATVVNFVASAVMIATAFYLRAQGVSAAVVGLSTSALAVGSLCGAVVAGFVVPRVRGGRLIVVSLLWIAVMFVPTGLVADNTIAVIALMTLAILAAPTLNAVFGGYLVAKVPPELQGRVDSAVLFFGSATAPLAPLVAGLGLDAAGYPGAITLCAALILVAGVPVLFCRGVREIPRPDQWESVT